MFDLKNLSVKKISSDPGFDPQNLEMLEQQVVAFFFPSSAGTAAQQFISCVAFPWHGTRF